MDDAEYPLSEEPLGALLEQVRSGAIQVPEFQRPVVLRDDWVRTLLASVSLGYPVGAVMLLEAGNPEYRFGNRPVEGAAEPSVAPQWLLVDGQHRVSALFQALVSSEGVTVSTGGDSSRRRYYLEASKVAAGADRDDAVVSLPADDTSDRGLSRLAGALGADVDSLLAAFANYPVPVIRLPKEATRWTIRVRGGTDGPALSEAYRVGRGWDRPGADARGGSGSTPRP